MAEGSPREALLEALHVRRYARIAVGIGAVVAVGVTVFFLGIVAGGRTQAPLWFYPSLAFVVFASASMLAATVLVARRVLHLTVHPAAVVRRAATGGLLAGLLWLTAAAGLVIGSGGLLIVELTLPWAALLSSFGLWAVHLRYKRTVPWRAAIGATAVAGVIGALIVADIAAFDLPIILGRDIRGVEAGTVPLFTLGVGILVGAQMVLSIMAVAGQTRDRTVPALLAGPSFIGLSGWAVSGAGPPGLASIAIGLGSAWVGACWHLRRTDNADIPRDGERSQ
ncbi:MAG: hypothetical protein ABEH64_05180 [Salinirussus sp.]